MNKKVSISIIGFIFILTIAFSNTPADTIYAGLRCSKYGLNPMLSTTELGKICKLMVKRFEQPGRSVIPCVVWISSTFDDATSNNYLTYFDNNGIKALLLVEPIENPVITIIADELTKFKSHPSVIGFGIDIEWYYPEDNNGLGRKVTDEDARTWRASVQSHNPNYLLLLTHFFSGWEPPTERDGIIFLDDMHGFPSFERFLNETNLTIGYRFWAKAFNPDISGMQYGYDGADRGQSDKLWWSKLNDPQKEIGDSCLQVGPNTKFLFWVDFTVYDVTWDFVSDTKNITAYKVVPASITVQNRTVSFNHKFLRKGKSAAVSLFDMNGRVIMFMTYADVSNGIVMKVASTLSQGIYMVQVESDNQIFSGRISLFLW